MLPLSVQRHSHSGAVLQNRFSQTKNVPRHVIIRGREFGAGVVDMGVVRDGGIVGIATGRVADDGRGRSGQ